MSHDLRYILLFALICGLHSPVALAVDFEADVAPLLIRRCVECHKGQEPSGGLSLESAVGLKRGGESGAVLADQPKESFLLQRVQDGEMPPPVKGVPQALPDAEKKVLSDWIGGGAKWPDGRVLDLYEVTTAARGGRDWWAFQPVKRPAVPGVRNAASEKSSTHPIDAFIVAALDRNGMRPAPRAPTPTIVRRMYFDLIGLPPTFDELETWNHRMADNDDAQNLIDHLLTSPHFGERWGRYWLDAVRYAETSGYERDQPKPFAWKYRDWVANAMNSDMPYDQFIHHQLAGDEVTDRNEATVIATGFLRLGTWNDEPNDDADYRYERLEDLVHVTSSAFLGLTVKCARCHDHKFDPIPQEDYYRMASAFWPGPIAGRDRELLGGPSTEELGFESVLGWTDLTATPPPLHLLKNGDSDKPMQVVTPGTLTFAPALQVTFASPGAEVKTTTRRRQLAEWIASPLNPLTARVAVNRIWQHHFGDGLVRSPNNFGYKRRIANSPGTAGLAGQRAYRQRLVDKAHSSVDSDVRHMATIVTSPGSGEVLRTRFHQSTLVGVRTGVVWMRNHGEILCWQLPARSICASEAKDSSPRSAPKRWRGFRDEKRLTKHHRPTSNADAACTVSCRAV